jgi:aerobic-type carbon monoxide dehydrogenase small subunit (CoxS/CutS family)
MQIAFTVNGEPAETDIQPRATLADCLRDKLKLTGTHVGCAHGVCGACTVMVDGEAVRSCLTLAVQADGRDVTTIEGLAPSGELGPLQAAFRKHHALQCGFCTPGMLMTLHALLTDEPYADETRIREVLGGNLCRCTGYIPIVAAACDARSAYQAAKVQP